MTLRDMVNKAKKHEILGTASSVIYDDLKNLTTLRNNVHPESTTPTDRQGRYFNPYTDTDFNAFSEEQVKKMAGILFEIFTGDIFTPSIHERRYFDYLENYIQ